MRLTASGSFLALMLSSNCVPQKSTAVLKRLENYSANEIEIVSQTNLLDVLPNGSNSPRSLCLLPSGQRIALESSPSYDARFNVIRVKLANKPENCSNSVGYLDRAKVFVPELDSFSKNPFGGTAPKLILTHLEHYYEHVKSTPYSLGSKSASASDCSSSKIFVLEKDGMIPQDVVRPNVMEQFPLFRECREPDGRLALRSGDFILLGRAGCSQTKDGIHWVTVASVNAVKPMLQFSESTWLDVSEAVLEQNGRTPLTKGNREINSLFASRNNHMCLCTRPKIFDQAWRSGTKIDSAAKHKGGAGPDQGGEGSSQVLELPTDLSASVSAANDRQLFDFSLGMDVTDQKQDVK